MTIDEYREAYNPDSPQGSVHPRHPGIARRAPSPSGLSVIVMNYMDANIHGYPAACASAP